LTDGRGKANNKTLSARRDLCPFRRPMANLRAIRSRPFGRDANLSVFGTMSKMTNSTV
jgi:hypothetical protein